MGDRWMRYREEGGGGGEVAVDIYPFEAFTPPPPLL